MGRSRKRQRAAANKAAAKASSSVPMGQGASEQPDQDNKADGQETQVEGSVMDIGVSETQCLPAVQLISTNNEFKSDAKVTGAIEGQAQVPMEAPNNPASVAQTVEQGQVPSETQLETPPTPLTEVAPLEINIQGTQHPVDANEVDDKLDNDVIPDDTAKAMESKPQTLTPVSESRVRPVTPDQQPSPPLTRYREHPRAEDVMLPVECGLNKALINLNKLHQGSRCACVKFEDTWMTPNQFQMISGRETAKDWKRSIKHYGKSLKILLNNDLLVLEPPVCLCEICTAEPGSVQYTGDEDNKLEEGKCASTSNTADMAQSAEAGESGPSGMGAFVTETSKKKDVSGDKKPRKRKKDNPSKAAATSKKKKKDPLALSDEFDCDSVDSDKQSVMEKGTGTMDFIEFINNCAPELKSDEEITNFAKELTKVSPEDSDLKTNKVETDGRVAEDANTVSHMMEEEGSNECKLAETEDENDKVSETKDTECSTFKTTAKKPKGSRLSSIIDVLRKTKEEDIQPEWGGGEGHLDQAVGDGATLQQDGGDSRADIDTVQELLPNLEGSSLSSRERLRQLLLSDRYKTTVVEPKSTSTRSKVLKKSELPGTCSKGDSRPKVATVPPLSHNHKPSDSSKSTKKAVSSSSSSVQPPAIPGLPNLGTDLFNITNPANFGWYLPYYASLGLANMMMVPFLSSQMMAFQSSSSSQSSPSESNTESSRKQNRDEAETIAPSSSKDKPLPSASAIDEPARPAESLSKATSLTSFYARSTHQTHTHTDTSRSHSQSRSSATSTSSLEAPLDLSLGKTSQKSQNKASSKSSASHTSGKVSPLDLSIKTSSGPVAKSQGSPHSHRKSSFPSKHKPGSSHKRIPSASGGFLNPALEKISKWSSDEVVKFVSSVEGCQQYTKNFQQVGVCGRSLPYLSLDHMTGLLRMCPSSAVSLRSAIDRLLLLPDPSVSAQAAASSHS